MATEIATHRLNLADVFHNGELTFRERRDVITHRIQRASWFNYGDTDLLDIAGFLADAADVQEFDEAWAMFCDWADEKYVGIITR